MVYAKINDQGEVLEFPYLPAGNPYIDVPNNMVEVDVTTNKPDVSWDEVYYYDQVVVSGDSYVATFTTSSRYSTDEERLKGITSLKLMRTQENDRTFNYKATELKKKYPEAEVDSWDQQRREALAYTDDNTVSTPLLSVIATERNISLADLSVKVITHATAYDITLGTLLGKYQKNRSLLNAIDLDDNTTWDNIDSIVRL